MRYEALEALARSRNWTDLERDWLAVIEEPDADPARLLPIIDLVVGARQTDLAETMSWMWLSMVKERRSPAEALRLGRGLILRLPDGEELREEILTLYRLTHKDEPNIEAWIDRSGLKSGKSVRRALRFLTTGLRLSPGSFLVHRTEDLVAEVTDFDFNDDVISIRTSRRGQTTDISKVIEDYEITDENDFRVLSRLHPGRLQTMIQEDPIAVIIGIVRCHENSIDRDRLKLLMVPRHLQPAKWPDWWTRIRNGVKRSPHLRIEGRSPMFVVYDEVGQSLEAETWTAFAKATTPREWLDLLEGYLRETRQQKLEPDAAFLNRVQTALVDHIGRFKRHKEPASAFATALVIERVAADGLPVSTDAHGMALEMLKQADDPVAVVASVPDTRLWSLGVTCIEQAAPDKIAESLAELILYAPAGQCDVLAKKVVSAGRGELLSSVVERATAEPGRFTDALLWVWKGPSVDVELPAPPLREILSIILSLVGPVRDSEGKAAGQTVAQMKSRVRTGLTSRGLATFKTCIEDLDLPLAQTIRRQIERAEGLGPRVQDDMLNILRRRYPKLYVKAAVAMWDDESVLYFTQNGLKTMEDELVELVNVKMKENARAIGEAAERGDLSENAEYKSALEERDLLRARVGHINSQISLAKLLDPDAVPADSIGIGQHITLRPAGGGEPTAISIMGAGDSDIDGRVFSYQTPLARQLLGKRIGDMATLPLTGEDAEYTITRIENALA